MPVIFEYLGIILMFYSNDHVPIHVHAEYSGGYATRVEFILKNGKVSKIEYKAIRGKKPLPPTQLKDLKKLISTYKTEIINDWIDFKVKNKKVKRKVITKKIK